MKRKTWFTKAEMELVMAIVAQLDAERYIPADVKAIIYKVQAAFENSDVWEIYPS